MKSKTKCPHKKANMLKNSAVEPLQTTFEIKIWSQNWITSEWRITNELIDPTKYAQNIRNATPNTSRRRCSETFSQGVQSTFMAVALEIPLLATMKIQPLKDHPGMWNQPKDRKSLPRNSSKTKTPRPTLFNFVTFLFQWNNSNSRDKRRATN